MDIFPAAAQNPGMDRNSPWPPRIRTARTPLIAALLGLLLPLLAWDFPAGAAQSPQSAQSPAAPLSDASQACLDCHTTIHPGIVEGWRRSRHARGTPAKALAAPELERSISAGRVPQALQKVAVGCAECHMRRSQAHADAFSHNGFTIHTVVSPEDCAACHPAERDQFAANIMAHAHGNLADNPTHQLLMAAINDLPGLGATGLTRVPASATDPATSCLSCHGTRLVVTGAVSRKTPMGAMDFPVIAGWPNTGVGRVNLDGSLGACDACHRGHQFALEEARRAEACARCHDGPNVPAYGVWRSSAHGRTAAGQGSYAAVPWTLGKDVSAPTCATCHMSQVINTEGEIVARRTHQVTDRLPWRLYGLPYAAAQPLAPDTAGMVNADGLHWPTAFDAAPVSAALIPAGEGAVRQARMAAICRGCHATGWVEGHFERLEANIADTNAATRTATALIQRAWDLGLAAGPGAGANPFDELPERLWTDVWLLHANNIRFATAMAGGGDHGAFTDGRYDLTRSVLALGGWLDAHIAAAPAPAAE